MVHAKKAYRNNKHPTATSHPMKRYCSIDLKVCAKGERKEGRRREVHTCHAGLRFLLCAEHTHACHCAAFTAQHLTNDPLALFNTPTKSTIWMLKTIVIYKTAELMQVTFRHFGNIGGSIVSTHK